MGGVVEEGRFGGRKGEGRGGGSGGGTEGVQPEETVLDYEVGGARVRLWREWGVNRGVCAEDEGEGWKESPVDYQAAAKLQ